MPDQAHVTSVEVIEEFRTHLVLYVSKARPTVEEIGSEVMRMRMWLQNDQRMTLEALVRRRTKELEQAQAALSGARMATLRQETSAEQMAVLRARRALEEAEAKLKKLKQWNRDFDSQVEPLAKQLDKLHTVLSHDMVNAAAHLSQVVTTLSAYADMHPGTSPAPAAPDAPPVSGAAAGPTEGKP
jgi:chromosome segregation ATPase